MICRQSVVDKLDILSLAYSSVLEIGDSTMITPYSKALAVQREYDVFLGSEGHFNSPVFYKPIPMPTIRERVFTRRINESPQIHVHSVFINGASFSGVIQVGSTHFIQGESRVKHVRQLKDNQNNEDKKVDLKTNEPFERNSID